MFIVIIAVVIFVVAMGAVIAAVLLSARNRKQQKNTPEITVDAKLLGTYDEIVSTNSNFSSGTVDSYNAWETKKYYAEFEMENMERKRFEINKKLFLSLSAGKKGVLKYQGNKLINFSVKN